MDKFEDVKEIQNRGAICCVFVVPLCMILCTLVGFLLDKNFGMITYKSFHIPVFTLIGLHLGLIVAAFSAVKMMKTKLF